MTVKRFILILVAVVLTVVLAVFSVKTYNHVHVVVVEEDVHGAFFPVTRALYDFEQDHGAPAVNLTQLIPKYIPQIPTSRCVYLVEYSVIDGGKAWQLNLHSRALSDERIYCCRSTQTFTPAEAKRIIRQYHSVWTVLKE